jgi:hypothetical protein
MKNKIFRFLLTNNTRIRPILIILNYLLLITNIIIVFFLFLASIFIYTYLSKGIPKELTETVFERRLEFDYSLYFFAFIPFLISTFLLILTYQNLKKTSFKHLNLKTFYYKRLYCKLNVDKKQLTEISLFHFFRFVFVIVITALLSASYLLINNSNNVSQRNDYRIEKTAWIINEVERIQHNNKNAVNRYQFDYKDYITKLERYKIDSLKYPDKLSKYAYDYKQYEIRSKKIESNNNFKLKKWISRLDYFEKEEYYKIKKREEESINSYYYQWNSWSSSSQYKQDRDWLEANGYPIPDYIYSPSYPEKPKKPNFPNQVRLEKFQDKYPEFTNPANKKHSNFWDVNLKRDLKYNVFPIILICLLYSISFIGLYDKIKNIFIGLKSKNMGVFFIIPFIIGLIIFNTFIINLLNQRFIDIELSILILNYLFVSIYMIFHKMLLSKILNWLQLSKLFIFIFFFIWIISTVIIEVFSEQIFDSTYNFIGFVYFISFPLILILINWITIDIKKVK